MKQEELYHEPLPDSYFLHCV